MQKKGEKTFIRILGALVGVVLSVIYLLNLSMGLVEIPDNLPFVGNVDEFVASGILIASLRYLGLDLTRFGRSKKKES
ncbi:DUF1232 domain-containing protein [candidate division KSB1 bacterium]|nr:DUF1232 domain-containing protein [candidate division KSB1 bacterium]